MNKGYNTSCNLSARVYLTLQLSVFDNKLSESYNRSWYFWSDLLFFNEISESIRGNLINSLVSLTRFVVNSINNSSSIIVLNSYNY